MGFFTPKHEIVEARQFIGGYDNALELTTWLTIRNSKSLFALNDHNKPDRIMIETSKYEYDAAGPGDWILSYPDGRIDIVRNGVFKERYAKV